MSTLTIFIHGIGSSSSTWDSFIKVLQSDNDTASAVKYTPNSTEVCANSTYYYLYDYKSKILGKGSIVSKITEKFSGTTVSGNITIDKHVDSLKSFISVNHQKFSKLNIVAHSLGGVVTMKLLLKLAPNPDLIKILDGVLLYGAPLKGSNEPNELKKYLGSKIPTTILQELDPNSRTITSLNQEIEKKYGYLKNNFRILYIKGDSDSRIIEIDEEYINKFGIMETIPGGHSDIINPENISDQSFIYCKILFLQSSNNAKERINLSSKAVHSLPSELLQELKSGLLTIEKKDDSVIYNENSEHTKLTQWLRGYIANKLENVIEIVLEEQSGKILNIPKTKYDNKFFSDDIQSLIRDVCYTLVNNDESRIDTPIVNKKLTINSFDVRLYKETMSRINASISNSNLPDESKRLFQLYTDLAIRNIFN